MILRRALIVLGAWSAVGSSVPDRPKVESVAMPRHSLRENGGAAALEFWEFFGAAVPTAADYVLLPNVVNRTGAIWTKEPLQTSNFEIEFKVAIRGPPRTATQGLALWYVHSPPPTDLSLRSYLDEWTLFGYSPKFDGLGLFISNHDRANQLNPSLSIAINDGTRIWDAESQVPSNDGVYYPMRNTPEHVHVKLQVGPMGILGQVRLAQKAQWTQCFKIAAPDVLRPGGYIGLTATTGYMEPLNDIQSGRLIGPADHISIRDIRMANFDLTKPGEAQLDEAEPDGIDDDVAAEDILREHGSHKDERELADTLRQLTRYVYKYTTEAVQREQAIHTHMATLQAGLARIGMDVKEIKIAMNTTGSSFSPDSETFDRVTSELSGLKNLFYAHSRQQATVRESIDQLQRKLDDGSGTQTGAGVQLLADQSRRLEATIRSQGAFSTWLFVIIIALIVFAGFMAWKRMRDLEKKHIL